MKIIFLRKDKRWSKGLVLVRKSPIICCDKVAALLVIMILAFLKKKRELIIIKLEVSLFQFAYLTYPKSDPMRCYLVFLKLHCLLFGVTYSKFGCETWTLKWSLSLANPCIPLLIVLFLQLFIWFPKNFANSKRKTREIFSMRFVSFHSSNWSSYLQSTAILTFLYRYIN